jgi:hypothetical protein
MRRRRAALVALAVILLIITAHITAARWLTARMAHDRTTPGAGPYEGAQSCAPCHAATYAEWRESLHARAATIDYAPMHLGLVRTAACRSCHGQPGGEGVACEVCHGPGHTAATRFGDEPVCLRCHAMENPVSGFPVLATRQEWLESRARQEGRDCVSCHMPREADGRHFHGFAGGVAHPEVYAGLVAIDGLELRGDRLHVAVTNRAQGHRMPTGCPSKYIRLRVRGRSAAGEDVDLGERLFERRLDALMTRELHDTRLDEDERRELELAVPRPVESVEAALELFPSEMFGPGRGRPILLDRKTAARETADRHDPSPSR